MGKQCLRMRILILTALVFSMNFVSNPNRGCYGAQAEAELKTRGKKAGEIGRAWLICRILAHSSQGREHDHVGGTVREIAWLGCHLKILFVRRDIYLSMGGRILGG